MNSVVELRQFSRQFVLTYNKGNVSMSVWIYVFYLLVFHLDGSKSLNHLSFVERNGLFVKNSMQ